MPGITHLYIPGPTNVPEAVRQAMNVQMEDHRSIDFPKLTMPLFEGLKAVFKNETGRVFLYPSSGTGAWEAAIENTLAPGDKVLMSIFGQFSHLWADMGRRLGLDVEAVECAWGTGVPVDRYAEILKADKDHAIKAVFATHNETATGVTSDIAAVRRALDDADHPALLFVDGVSSIGSIDFRQEEWRVDLAVSGSQKGLMLPPGLGVLSVSQRAIAAAATNDRSFRRCYFAFADMIATNDLGFFPYTPPTPLLHGLNASLALLFAEGLDQVFARHHRIAAAVRAGIDAWGLNLCASEPRWYSDTVSAVLVPDGIDSNAVVRHAYQVYNTALGTGLSKVAGKVFRIGHIGWMNEVMACASLSAAELTLRDLGADIVAGSGVGAAIAHFNETAAGARKLRDAA